MNLMLAQHPDSTHREQERSCKKHDQYGIQQYGNSQERAHPRANSGERIGNRWDNSCCNSSYGIANRTKGNRETNPTNKESELVCEKTLEYQIGRASCRESV